MNIPALLSFFCGFVSLSLEILWIRFYGFTMMSTPTAFGFVLMAYLTGIALGARAGGRACRNHASHSRLWSNAARAVILSSLATLALPFVFSWIQSQWWRNLLIDFSIIAFVSSILAYVFPIVHHMGVNADTERGGRRFATVYVSNIIGATLGPLITGYILLNLITLQQAYFCLALLQVLGAIVILLKFRGSWLDSLAGILAGFYTIFIGVFGVLMSPHYLIQQVNATHRNANQIVENRYGIITIFSPIDKEKYKPGDDAVYGGNVYDGRTNLSLRENTNGLHRLLLMSALHPQPKRVLMVGLSIGSWLSVINGFPDVEKIDVIEINPGYLQAAQVYGPQARAMEDPRVNILIDDARRWLKLNPYKKYDMIIMNTTWHWRVNSTFLLSESFFNIIKSHMADGGILAFNGTGSPDAFYTVANIFSNAYRYGNFIYAADFDFRKRKDTAIARNIYSKLTIDDKPAFSAEDPNIEKFLNERFFSIEEDEGAIGRGFEMVTDNNMITEFKYGRRLKFIQ